MKIIFLSVLMLLFVEVSSLAEEWPQPQSPLLKDISSCFHSLPIGRRTKSHMQFYSEIVKSKGPSCQPLMLIVRDDNRRIPKLSVYRDNSHGNIQGLHMDMIPRDVGRSSYVRVGEPNGREDVTYTCRFTSKENIAQYGEQKRHQPLIVNYKSSPPAIQSDRDFASSSEAPKKSLLVKEGYDERVLLGQVRSEILLRTQEMKTPGRLSRGEIFGLEKCLDLLSVRSHGKKERADQEELKIKQRLEQWLSSSTGRKTSSPKKSEGIH